MSFLNYYDKYKIIPRDKQVEIDNLISKEWKLKKYFYISAPPGVGKTYVALSIADNVNSTFLLTCTKMLQEQYEKQSPALINIQGRSNYVCAVDNYFNCDVAPCTGNPKQLQKCIANLTCPYVNKKNAAIAAKTMITNYSYFLNACSNPESQDSTQWDKREVLILDEAHELEKALIKHAEIILTPSDFKKFFLLSEKEDIGVEFSDTDTEHNLELLNIIADRFVTKYDHLRNSINKQMENSLSGDLVKQMTSKFADNMKAEQAKISDLGRMLDRIQNFRTDLDRDNWIVTGDCIKNTLTISPIYSKGLFNKFFDHMADKFVFMSATLPPPKVLCKELGIDINDMCIINVGTPFNAEKSPIYHLPIGKMSYKELDSTLPMIVSAVETLLEKHQGEKGIIHSGTYNIAQHIINNVDKPTHHRLIARDAVQDGTKYNNAMLLTKHTKSEKDTVLISPSMTTGIDLIGDLSTFQIIVKMPFMSLADARIKRKSEIDPLWYRSEAWLTIMQASCRSTRTEDDKSVTYILDSSLNYFLGMDIDKLPHWFLERLLPHMLN